MNGDVLIEMPMESSKHHPERDTNTVNPKYDLSGIISLTVDAESTNAPSKITTSQAQSRWNTPEFYFYAVTFVIVVPVMIWIPITLSQKSHPNYYLYKEQLSQGWIFGRQIDNSDAQYRSFRDNIPGLLAIVGMFFICRNGYTRFFTDRTTSTSTGILHRIPFICLFSFALLLILHGSSAIKIYILLIINYYIAKSCGASNLNPILTWVYNIAIIFANEKFDGYRFSSLHDNLSFLDALEGVYPRWQVTFNISMLRLVSFNMDYFWKLRGSPPITSNPPITHRERTTFPHPEDVYCLTNYLAYALYPPLYIAGPIMTFNDFMWQHRRPVPGLTWQYVKNYFIRFIACLMTMELILHFMYVVAIKDASAWRGDSPFELSMVGFWNLIIVWLKLLIPWRFFRLWSLVDGIEAPENMIRCMANNYSPLGFWRSWHRSFNLWTIRYLYIPMGGTNNLLLSSALIFSFVAFWHDLSLRLLAWGWLICLFIVPEVGARFVLPPTKYGQFWWYRHLSALGAVSNILMMMTANLVGFVIGMDGMKYMLGQLFGSIEGLKFLSIACACIFVAVQVMFEYREEELRHGIVRRC